jgi:hypothetical protein
MISKADRAATLVRLIKAKGHILRQEKMRLVRLERRLIEIRNEVRALLEAMGSLLPGQRMMTQSMSRKLSRLSKEERAIGFDVQEQTSRIRQLGARVRCAEKAHARLDAEVLREDERKELHDIIDLWTGNAIIRSP